MDQQSTPQNPLVLSYLAMRQAVGFIGIALPPVLVVGKILLQGPGIQSSISSYHYTDMRTVFEGSLCALGVFLLCTRGYDRQDEIAGRLASAFVIGVALLPTTPDAGATSREQIIGGVHLSFAALFYLTLAYFSIALFTKTAQENRPTPQKLKRNMVYRVCGYIILVCLLLIGIVKLSSIEDRLQGFSPVFWLESVATMSFGLSWLTKGETILKDKQL